MLQRLHPVFSLMLCLFILNVPLTQAQTHPVTDSPLTSVTEIENQQRELLIQLRVFADMWQLPVEDMDALNLAYTQLPLEKKSQLHSLLLELRFWQHQIHAQVLQAQLDVVAADSQEATWLKTALLLNHYDMKLEYNQSVEKLQTINQHLREHKRQAMLSDSQEVLLTSLMGLAAGGYFNYQLHHGPISYDMLLRESISSSNNLGRTLWSSMNDFPEAYSMRAMKVNPSVIKAPVQFAQLTDLSREALATIDMTHLQRFTDNLRALGHTVAVDTSALKTAERLYQLRSTSATASYFDIADTMLAWQKLSLNTTLSTVASPVQSQALLRSLEVLEPQIQHTTRTVAGALPGIWSRRFFGRSLGFALAAVAAGVAACNHMATPSSIDDFNAATMSTYQHLQKMGDDNITSLQAEAREYLQDAGHGDLLLPAYEPLAFLHEQLR